MAKQFKVAEDVAYTCETAAHFWLLHVLARWEKFLAQVKAAGNSPSSVKVSKVVHLNQGLEHLSMSKALDRKDHIAWRKSGRLLIRFLKAFLDSRSTLQSPVAKIANRAGSACQILPHKSGSECFPLAHFITTQVH